MSLLIHTASKRQLPVFPWVNLMVIVSCTLILGWYYFSTPADQNSQLRLWSMHPEVWESLPATLLPWLQILRSAISAVFFHIQWPHLIGNMAFLMVFGWPVERQFDHRWYLVFFVLSGMLVNLIVFIGQVNMSGEHILPVIGASGSVSAVIGCYLGLKPAGRIGVYLPLGVFPQFARLPALLVILAWFVLQIIHTLQGGISSQMALKIHLSGFGIGMITALLFRLSGRYHSG